MKRSILLFLCFGIWLQLIPAQAQQRPQQGPGPVDVIRIRTDLVQTDVVVVDKSEQIVTDLKLEDFELYDKGKKQDLKFLEFVSVNAEKRIEGESPADRRESEKPSISAKELKRVIAFVIDDLTIPYADLVTVRQVVKDFVDNQMSTGDLVAIIRTVGGKGLLQQFTSDKRLLHRAIASLRPITHPFSTSDTPAERLTGVPTPSAVELSDGAGSANPSVTETADIANPNDEVNRLFRGLFSLSTATFVIQSLRQLPGRKSLVFVSGGIPVFETGSTGTAYSNVSYLINRLADEAVRAGVVVNTIDPRGLKATPGVVGYRETPAKSGLSGEDPTFGRGGTETAVFGPALRGAEENLSLQTLSTMTGGVSVVNANNMKAGLDKILARSAGYYILAYRPSEPFDNKFHELKIKVKREGLRVYSHRGYMANDDYDKTQQWSKEQAIIAAAQSPLAKREVDVVATHTVRLQPINKAALGIDLVIDPNTLTFTAADATQQTAFDVVGFIYDQLGKMRGGFSETVNVKLGTEDYKRALATGIIYSANTELPPGYYQVRAVVRESTTGKLGTNTTYLEIPDLTKGRPAVSSVLLFAVDPTKDTSVKPLALDALRQISRKLELRYATTVFNVKNKQLRSQLIISQGNKILFREAEQPITPTNETYVSKIGQLALAKVAPGRYSLTLLIIDPSADKKTAPLSRSVDFTVTP